MLEFERLKTVFCFENKVNSVPLGRSIFWRPGNSRKHMTVRRKQGPKSTITLSLCHVNASQGKEEKSGPGQSSITTLQTHHSMAHNHWMKGDKKQSEADSPDGLPWTTSAWIVWPVCCSSTTSTERLNRGSFIDANSLFVGSIDHTGNGTHGTVLRLSTRTVNTTTSAPNLPPSHLPLFPPINRPAGSLTDCEGTSLPPVWNCQCVSLDKQEGSFFFLVSPCMDM